MKLYRARIRGTNEYLTFNGEVLFASSPEVFAILLETKKGSKLFIEDLEIIESEWEKVHEY